MLFGLVKVFYQQVIFTQHLAADREKPLYIEAVSQGCADAGLCYPPYSLYFKVDIAQKTWQSIDADVYQARLSNAFDL